MKTLGLATSPTGQWLATCFSLHPGDTIEYFLPGAEKTIVAFWRQKGAIAFPDGCGLDYNAEALLFEYIHVDNGFPSTSLFDRTTESLAHLRSLLSADAMRPLLEDEQEKLRES
ncbi:MAG: hypothetical protein M1826_007595 [Phylliscum demangeonii]|nr:MAG: hypothetical protein M1826_007595 [Phylliscum demangeonii]